MLFPPNLTLNCYQYFIPHVEIKFLRCLRTPSPNVNPLESHELVLRVVLIRVRTEGWIRVRLKFSRGEHGTELNRFLSKTHEGPKPLGLWEYSGTPLGSGPKMSDKAQGRNEVPLCWATVPFPRFVSERSRQTMWNIYHEICTYSILTRVHRKSNR